MTKPKQKQDTQSITLKTTGERIEDKKTAKQSLKDLKSEQKAIEKEYQEKIGLLQHDQQLIKEAFEDKKPIIIKRDDEFFYQLKKTKENNHNILELSHSARELLFLLMLHMDYMDNVITIDRKYPSNEELQTLFKMSKQTFQKALKELKEMDIVHLERKTKYRVITLNPYYIEDTKTTDNTWKKFKKR